MSLSAPVAVPVTPEKRWFLRREWQLIALLWFCYALNHADRQVVYTLFPALQKEFGYSDAILGLTGSLFLWVYGFCSPFAGLLGDRFSKTSLVAGSLALWSVFTALSGLSPNGTFLLVCRAMLGVSESVFFPAAYALMAAAHGPTTRSRAMGIFATSQPFGMALGGSLSGLLAEQLHWRVPFWLLGALGLTFALPLMWFFRRMPAEFARGEITARPSFKRFGSLLHIRTLLVLASLMGVATFGVFLVYTWLPTVLYDKFHLGLARAGFESSVYPQIGSAIGLVAGGWMADRFGARIQGGRYWVLLSAFIGAACSIFSLGMSGTLGLARASAMAFAFFAGTCTANQYPAAFDVAPASLRATVVGGMNLLAALVSGFAPFLGGVSRRLIGVDGLMTFTSGVYLVAGSAAVLGISRFLKRDFGRAQALEEKGKP